MSSSARFEGKVFLVTGASSGIGAVTAEHLAAQGAHVWIAARRKQRLETLRDKINAAPGNGQATVAVLDVTDWAQVEKVVADVVEAHGKLDGAFNNAGYIPPASPLIDTDLDELVKTFNINTISQAACMKAELKQMVAQGHGSIVNNTSMFGHKVMTAGYTVHQASKAALNNFTIGAAMEAASAGVRVNAIAPGPTAPSEMLDATIARMQASNPNIDAEAAFRNMIPLGKMVHSEDIAAMVAFLLDERVSRSITGQVISVDGGAGVNFCSA